MAILPPMRFRRFHFVVALALCWAHVAALFAGTGLIRLCQDPGGASHVEVSARACGVVSSDGRDRSGLSVRSVEERAVCACGPCVHVLLSDARTLVRPSQNRIDPDRPDVRVFPAQSLFVSALPELSPRPGVPVGPPRGLPPDTAVSLGTVILLI